MATSEDSVTDDLAQTRLLNGLLAEYNFVTSLIPMYRRIEHQSITALGVTVGAVGSIFAALSGGKSEGMQSLSYRQLGVVMALLSWIFLIFLSVQITAMLRIRRANQYLVKYLYPKLGAVAPGLFEAIRPDFRVGFETVPSLELIHPETTSRVRNATGKLLITSGATTLGLAIGGTVAGLGAVALSTYRGDVGVSEICVLISSGLSVLLLFMLGHYGFGVSSGNERVKNS